MKKRSVWAGAIENFKGKNTYVLRIYKKILVDYKETK